MIGFCEHLINQEVLAVLEHVGKENCYIVTNGVTEFQMDKIRRSIGEEGFAGIRVVTGSKKDEIAEICKKHSDEHIVFVDDKQKYFSDIDRDVCKNLQTVLFDKSSGVTRLKKAINEAFTREGKENLFDISSPSEISLPYQEGEIKV
jgi:DNA topoisomerase IB